MTVRKPIHLFNDGGAVWFHCRLIKPLFGFVFCCRCYCGWRSKRRSKAVWWHVNFMLTIKMLTNFVSGGAKPSGDTWISRSQNAHKFCEHLWAFCEHKRLVLTKIVGSNLPNFTKKSWTFVWTWSVPVCSKISHLWRSGRHWSNSRWQPVMHSSKIPWQLWDVFIRQLKVLEQAHRIVLCFFYHCFHLF